MSNMMQIETSDKEIIQVEVEIMKCSALIKNLYDLTCLDEPLQLDLIDFKIMTMIVNWATHHKEEIKKWNELTESNESNPTTNTEPQSTKELTIKIGKWDHQFMNIDQLTILKLLEAANFLDIDPLLNMLCSHVSKMISGKTPQELRDLFNIENDLSDVEEE